MHPARPFLETGIARLVRRARAHPFALICVTDGIHVHAAHAPILLDETDSAPVLRFHLSAANAATTALIEGTRALIVFTGDHAYVSPDEYGQDDPVEAEGPITRFDNTGATRRLDDLSALFEAGLSPKPAWTRAKMVPGRCEAMLPGIPSSPRALKASPSSVRTSRHAPARASSPPSRPLKTVSPSPKKCENTRHDPAPHRRTTARDAMTQYPIAVHHPDDYDPAIGEDEAMSRDIDALNDEMAAAGVRVFVGGLQPARQAMSLRPQPDGQVLIAGGRYLQTSDHVGGFWALEVADLDAATAWRRKAAVACRAPVEVRQFH